MANKQRILLLDAYDAPSHQYWRKGLVEYLTEYDWTVLTLPPRFFRWRIRGNGLTWGKGDFSELDQAYDVIIATSMVDLTTLRGFKPRLGLIPTLVYFHENQFAYPEQHLPENQNKGAAKKVESIDPQIVNLYSALAAKQIAFNSEFNRASFIQGANKLLKKLPDAVPKCLINELEQKSRVLPVPMQDSLFIERKRLPSSKPIHLLWNHRWEYDKAPDRLALMVNALLAQGFDFRLHIVGQSFRSVPQELLDLKARCDKTAPQVIETFGFLASKQDYLALLQHCDLVLSTALHDFQGLSVIEAVASGCIPVVPDRLAYTHWFEPKYRYPSDINDVRAEAQAMAEHIVHIANNSDEFDKAPNLHQLSWEHLAANYRALIDCLCEQHGD